MSRIVCWYSCGAASAVATKIVVEHNRRTDNLPLVIARCRIDEEHPDNDRFAAACAKWFDELIVELSSPFYGTSIFNVFEQRRYIAGTKGAPCTLYLKKKVREDFSQPGDIHVMGYTVEEQGRVDAFIDGNNHVYLWPILVERGLTHPDCLAMVERAGIDLPVMYKMGYQHNNCVGCVKGGAGYWNKIRVDFPAAFERMAALEQKLGAKLINLTGNVRISLSDLDPSVGDHASEPSIQCGIFCEMAEDEYRPTPSQAAETKGAG